MITAEHILESIQLIQLNERNVHNTEEIDKWLKEIGREVPSSRSDIEKWLQKSVRLYLINKYENIHPIRQRNIFSNDWVQKALAKGEEVYEVEIDKDFEEKILHVIQYLLEDSQAPKGSGLFKVSVPDIIETSQTWIERVHLGVEVIKKYGDGFKWVKLTTPETVEREGEILNNCLKENPEVYAKDGVYSLRDRSDNPHVAFIINQHKEVEDIKGKNNQPVSKKYLKYLDVLYDEDIGTDFNIPDKLLRFTREIRYEGDYYSLEDDLSDLIDTNHPEETAYFLAEIMSNHVSWNVDAEGYVEARVWIVKDGKLEGSEKEEWMEDDELETELLGEDGELKDGDIIIYPLEIRDELDSADDIMNAFGYKPHQRTRGHWDFYYWRPKK